MPDRIVIVDGVQHVFPADATDQEISDALNSTASTPQGWGSSIRAMASPEGVAGLKQYGKELLTGEGPARSQALNFGKQEGGAFLSTLNPINQAKGVLRLVTTNPVTTATNVYGTGKAALEGDPRAIGSILGAVVAPKADAAALRGINAGANAIAESPSAQRGAGYIGGAGAGIVAGAHPFIMARIGQAVGPVIGSAARGVADVTGKVMDVLGMSEPPVPYANRDIAQNPIGPKSLHDLAVDQGFDPYAPNVSAGRVSAPFGPSASDVPIPQSPFERYAPNISAGPSTRPFGPSASDVPVPSPIIERYAPNISASTGRSGEVAAAASGFKPIAQGIYAQLPDGSWGVKALPGHTLVAGEPVNIANSAGQMAVKTVGKVGPGPDGIATLAGDTPLPSGPMSFHGQPIDPAIRALIEKRLHGE